MKLDLDVIEARAKAATPGPWEHWKQPYAERSGSGIDDSIFADNRVVFQLAGVHKGDAAHIAGLDPPTVLALVARAREADRLEEIEQTSENYHRDWLREAARADAAEAETTRLRAVVEKLRAGLTYIRLSEWRWQGAGSPIRLPKKASQIASKALGEAAALPDGWPKEDEHEICAAAARLLAETAPDVPEAKS